MGVGLIRNQERLDNYGAQMRQLATALRDHMADATEPVFAEGISVPELPNAVENIPEVTETPAPTPQPTATPPQSDTTAAINPPALGEVDALISPIPASYTIQPGDSLLAISLYFFGDTNMVNEILALNGIENADHIIAGRTIALPQR
jgi:nucleoid-associated protein YgaU